MDYRKITSAAWGPIKVIMILWIFLILILTFINFIFFDPEGIFIPFANFRIAFGILNVCISGLLFLFWLIVWNTLVKTFFKEDLEV